jgi:hypothetical protein
VQDEYRADFNKLRTIDVTLITGQMIHIPAYWWYSIKFVKSNTTICVFKYKTYMNTLAISNHLVMRLLQGQNTKRVVASKMHIVENKSNSNTSDKNEDHSEERGDYVSIPVPTASSGPLPNDAIPIPYDIHQKSINTLDTENTLNDDIIKKKLDTNSSKSEEEVIINL